MHEQQFLAHINESQGIIYKLVALYADNEEEKKDLYQEILLQAWKGWPGFRADSRFSTWLYRICLNTIFTQQRRKKPLTYIDSLEPISPEVSSLAMEQEDVKRLQQAIRSLAETDRALISLHLDGYNNGEIGDMLGISNNHVAVKMHRVKQQLAQLLKK